MSIRQLRQVAYVSDSGLSFKYPPCPAWPGVSKQLNGPRSARHTTR